MSFNCSVCVRVCTFCDVVEYFTSVLSQSDVRRRCFHDSTVGVHIFFFVVEGLNFFVTVAFGAAILPPI